MKTYLSIRIEGGLFGPDLLEALAAAELPGQRPQDFGLPARRNLTDEIAAVFNDTRALWSVFQHRFGRVLESDLATSLTRDAWMIPFFGLLGFELTYNQRAYEVDGLTFAISHRAGGIENAPPVNIVGIRQELGRLAPSGRPRLSPHSLMQEYLNRSEALWGIVTNGKTLRLLRDSTFVRRQAYVEFDLEAIFTEERFADFVILYRLLHRTRFPQAEGETQACLLEQYYNISVEQGGRVRDHLANGVEECLKLLANGFLRHPGSEALRTWVQAEGNALVLYRELLRLVYRFLFLLVSEERGLISADPLYLEQYGISRLRHLADQRSAYTEDDDLWHSLQVLWVTLTDEKMAPLLHIPPLNGELFAPLHLDSACLTNRNLLEAFWCLAYYQESSSSIPRRVNYSALDTEELGSVYESLLEFHPQMDWHGQVPIFDLVELGEERRSTGSHYTPSELVAPLIQNTLEPILKERLLIPVTQKEKEIAILGIKVCDPACGSGHFLLAAARRLGRELARVRSGEDEPAPERVREAIRDVVAHCIYGVDKNPLAIELCRVALWLESHAEGHPLTFLDHHIRCGDSLIGILDLNVLKEGIPDKAFDPLGGDNRASASSLKRQNQTERDGQMGLFAWNLDSALKDISNHNRELDAIPDNTPEQVRHKRQLFDRHFVNPDWRRQKEACDLWTAAFFQPLTIGGAAITTETVHNRLAGHSIQPQAIAKADAIATEERFFHWSLEFPDVFEFGGFDIVLGNPPFMGGLKISGAFGEHYRHWLECAFAPFGGTADLCVAFFRRAYWLVKPGGRFGMIATNTIGQGDTRESGLSIILKEGGIITFAKRFVKWPGRATVEVNLIAVCKGKALDTPKLDGQIVDFISSRLDDEPEAEPQHQNQNEGNAYQGSIVLGMGFAMDPSEAQNLISKDARNADCIFPYLNGEDLNSHPLQQPSRLVINFYDWDLEHARQYSDLIRIVEEKVKPEREKLRDSIPIQAKRKRFWWQYGSAATQLYQAISPLQRVLVRSRVSELHMIVFISKRYVFSDATVVFAFEDNYHFALLQSTWHEVWLRKWASSLRTDIRYTPTDCFETFPFPPAEYAEGNLRNLLEMPSFLKAERLGGEYHELRRQIMVSRLLGLTRTYNLFNDPACSDVNIVQMRKLHGEMDRAIQACYDWQDIDLRLDFYQTNRGQTRFTVSPEARREMLRRLLALNLELASKEQSTKENPLSKEKDESIAESDEKPHDNELDSSKDNLRTSDYGLYRCGECGKMVIGFDREKHVATAHKNKAGEWTKVR